MHLEKAGNCAHKNRLKAFIFGTFKVPEVSKKLVFSGVLCYTFGMDYKLKTPPKTKPDYAKMPHGELVETVTRMDAEISELKTELSNIISMVKLNNHKKYGKSGDSVKYPEGYEQLSFFNEAEKYGRKDDKEPGIDTAVKAPKKPKEKGKRDNDFKGLPVNVIEYTIPDEELDCPVCGGGLHDMKVEVTRCLRLVPAHFEVDEHRRHVYSCRGCEKNQGEGDKIPFIRAEMPELPIPGSFASPELIAAIINSKYTNHNPLSRIESEFGRKDSVLISRQTMSNWMLKVSENHFSRIHNRMREVLLSLEVLHADETWVKVVYEDGRLSKSKSYMWTYCSGVYDKPIVYYEYHRTRAAEAADEFLKDYRGYLHTDGYQVYHGLKPWIIVIGCLSHIKRKFTDAIKSFTEEEKKTTCCYRGQEYCDLLFELEKKFIDLAPEERYEKRLMQLKPIMEAFNAWLGDMFLKSVPDSPAYKAIQYALNQWPYFENVLLDGRLEITNNLIERSIRPFTQGRKNWYTMKTARGAQDSAVLYSVIQTAIENDLKVYDYLVYVLKEMPSIDFNKNPELIDKFVPWSDELPAICFKTKDKK